VFGDGCLSYCLERSQYWVYEPVKGMSIVHLAGSRAPTIAEVRPQSVQRPIVGRQQLTLRLEASVCRPELGGEEESSVRFGAARIDGVRVGGTGAG
jgi:hypothetical protein